MNTLYFGGGTPSLIPPELLVSVIETLKETGFSFKPDAEITLEINPATLTGEKLETLMRAGFNRFSVGAQSFNDALLKRANRIHSAQDTRDTLSLLKNNSVNFSMDILFALPTQTLDDLKRDIDEALTWDPPHVSPYCLTVPEGHPFSKGRAPEDEQIEMFELLESGLVGGGLARYEISNFAKPGFESRHNLLYWNDDEYWGVGLSSHSYLHQFDWGCRFWNPRNIDEYVSQIDSLTEGPWSLDALGEQIEKLELYQSLTDFFHTSLRKDEGLSYSRFRQKYNREAVSLAGKSIKAMQEQGLIYQSAHSIGLTKEGRLLSNKVFEEFTFLKGQLA